MYFTIIKTRSLTNCHYFCSGKTAYFLSDTGFDSAKSVVVLLGVALALKANDAGGPDKIIDVVKANPLLSAIFALKLYIAYF